MKTFIANRSHQTIILLATLLPLLLFTNKAFHIDDTVYIWCAKQILASPFDFYGFNVNWYGHEGPMYLTNQNPPLISYYIALIIKLFGESEPTLHLAFLVPAVLFAFGIYRLAGFFCETPLHATLLAIFSPAFIVSSTTIMSDITMLCFYTWSAVFWLQGLEKSQNSALFLSAILASLAFLTKYYGITLVPLLFIYSVATKRRMGTWALFLLLPILTLVSYQITTNALYGQNLFFNAAAYSLHNSPISLLHIVQNTAISLSFLGGVAIGFFFFYPLIITKRQLLLFFLSFLTFSLFLIFTKLGPSLLSYNTEAIPLLSFIQNSLFISLGITFLFISLSDIFKNKDNKSLFLFLWFIGSFSFATFLNWSITSRTIIPAVPILAILITRIINSLQVHLQPNFNKLFILLLTPAVIISLFVAIGDASFANTDRLAARNFHAGFNKYNKTVWFQGHWGFQYYMEKYGMKPLAFDKSRLEFGDVVITPVSNANCLLLDKQTQATLVEIVKIISNPWISTMCQFTGAGFYSSNFGPLPYSFGDIPPNNYYIYISGEFKSPEAAKEFYLMN